MSLNATMAAALSGLAATSRGVGTVSANIANALTPGYAPRDLALAARGPGVAVTGVQRQVDAALAADRRLAAAAEAAADARAAGWATIDAGLGTPGEPGSLTARLADFAGALQAAAGEPESALRLEALRQAAAGVAEGLRAGSGAVAAARQGADRAIAADVSALGEGLAEIDDLNRQILRRVAPGQETAALEDQRQARIDRIAPLVALRVVERPDGTVALFTATGATLLDGRPAMLGARAAAVVAPDATVASGGLAPVTLDGRVVAAGPAGPLAGGRIAANLALRDADGPEAQTALDAVARDLAARFAEADPTLVPGAPGLFVTIGGTGAAARIVLNPRVDPGAGGTLARLRDGIGTDAPGPAGRADQLMRLAAAFDEPRPASLPGMPEAARGAVALAGDAAGLVATRRLAAQDRAEAAGARAVALREATAAAGVDTDAQLQALLRLERAYAANAQVIRTADRMLDTLLRMG